jgi:hypothetical protein
MRTTRLTLLLAKLALVALVMPACVTAVAADVAMKPTTLQQTSDLVDRMNRLLRPTEAQKPDVDRIVREHGRQIEDIKSDATLSNREKRSRIHESLTAMAGELKPILDRDQVRRLNDYLTPKSWFPTEYEVSASYEVYLPTETSAQNIFGKSPSAFGLGVQFYQPGVTEGAKLGWSVDLFSLVNNSNSEFVLAPQVMVIQYAPIAQNTWVFGKLSAGPAYFDYSYNTPLGAHYGAKRLGFDGGAEVGLRYGQVELAANYRVLTDSAVINLSGLQLSLTWYVFHFRI